MVVHFTSEWQKTWVKKPAIDLSDKYSTIIEPIIKWA